MRNTKDMTLDEIVTELYAIADRMAVRRREKHERRLSCDCADCVAYFDEYLDHQREASAYRWRPRGDRYDA